MTAYEQGFLTKCAEYGFDGSEMLKIAISKTMGGVIGATIGGPLLGPVGMAAGRAMTDNGPGWGYDEYNKNTNSRMQEIAQNEGLELRGGAPGTMLSRGWNRLTRSREGYGKWLAGKANEQIEDARGRQRAAYETNQRQMGYMQGIGGSSKANPEYMRQGNPGFNQYRGPSAPAQQGQPASAQQGQPAPAAQGQPAPAQQGQPVFSGRPDIQGHGLEDRDGNPIGPRQASGNPAILDLRSGSRREPLSGANRGQQMGATSLNAQNNYGQGWGRGFVPGPQDYERQGMRQMNRPTPAPSWQTNLPKPRFVPAV